MNPYRGILLKLASVTVFSVMGVLIKATRDHIPAGEAVFFRSFFAIPVILVWLAYRAEIKEGLATSNPMNHVWRGLIGTSAMGLGFWGLGLLPLPEVTAIGYAAPILTVIFAAMFLGEQIRAVRLSAVVLGLIGVLIILSPRLGSQSNADATQTLGAIVVFASAVCGALAGIFVRKMTQTESTSAIVFYFSCTASTLALFTIPGWVMPTPLEFGFLVLSGLFGGLGQILLTSCYRFADAGVLAPFDYTSMLFAIAFGYFFFAELPTMTVIAGTVLVISAGVLIIWRERQLGLERARQRKAMTPQG